MKIGIVLYPTFGGSGVVATELGKSLAKRGHNVHFITYSQPVRLGTFRENVSYHEVSVSDYPLFEYQPYETVLASKMVDVVKHEGLDILHVHYAIPHASAAFMAKMILKSQGIDIPFVTTLHGTDITLVGRDPSFEPVITFCLNESDAVTAVSKSLKEDTYKHFSTTRPIEVIPNFITVPDDFQNLDRSLRECYASEDEFLLCHVSNFRKVKRVEDVLLVFQKVNAVKPSRLLLVGDGPERYKLEELCRELDLCERVKFLGKVTDTQQVLQISDIFILPSETESFGLAALEAMAVGVPVISSNTGGIPEVNVHGVTGFLSNVGDTDDMAKNALEIFKDDKTLEQFRKNAQVRARQFDLDSVVQQYEDVYNSLLEAVKIV
ncbi:MAG: N-acetyl-alpha-D-glucosaminyl L-malate synthase BshA [Crocinitomicaceae bacterium]|nr:N-acetyl-alpha-D-glucosaminyl L-malate synthase BshA [Flavobacteriales bacterium]NQZ36121.1 N-acetyl-alpha-D-glucosaminyl L-malate synthase BshA [Crocinitomicaceae bacterium]